MILRISKPTFCTLSFLYFRVAVSSNSRPYVGLPHELSGRRRASMLEERTTKLITRICDATIPRVPCTTKLEKNLRDAIKESKRRCWSKTIDATLWIKLNFFNGNPISWGTIEVSVPNSFWLKLKLYGIRKNY